MWKNIDGYFWPYRINDQAEVERLNPKGNWVRIKHIIDFSQSPTYPRVIVRMKGLNGKFKNVNVNSLMRNAFFPDLPEGIRLAHKNGMATDCALENLLPMTHSQCGKKNGGRNRRSIEKVDREGNVVAVYSTTIEAAKKNFISRKAIWIRCKNQLKDPYLLDGYTYRYAR